MLSIKNWSIHNWILVFMLVAIASWYSYSFVAGERVWAGGGAGWDGTVYAKLSMDFQESLASKSINAYYIQHSLPSAIVNYSTKALGISLTNTKEVINAFLILRFVLLIIIGVFLWKISGVLKFSNKTKYVLYASVYLTVPILKKMLYLPVGTDVTALAIGVIVFYYYLKSNYVLLFLFSMIGAFVYPSMIYTGAIMILFPREKIRFLPNKENWNKYIKIFLVVLYGVFAYLIVDSGFQSKNSSQQVEFGIITISVALIVFYIYRMLKPVTIFVTLQSWNYKKIASHIIGGVGFVVILKFIIALLANNLAAPLKVSTMFDSIMYGSVVNPLVSLVAHISYYGPLIFILIVFWKQIFKEVENLGLALIVFVGLYMFMTLGRESRQFINAWPVFVIVACIFINKVELSWRFIYMFIIMSLIFSKVWFNINIEGISTKNGLLNFPAQRFFMMNGAWMSTKVYYWHLAGEVLLYGVFYWFLKKEPALLKQKNV